jgi:F-type H+-transporting ATPase subunit delta
MKETRVAIRYAKSLLSLAKEQGVLEEVKNDMDLVSQTCADNKDFELLLKSPIVKGDKKLAILNAVLENQVNQMTLAFVEIITKKGRESVLAEIAESFINQYRSDKNITTALIKTAVPMTDELRTQIQELIKQSAKGEVELVEEVDAELVGGFVLRISDQQVNTSIQNQLHKLKREFDANPYIKEY